MTDAEQKLWRHIRRRQVLDCRFRRQHPVGPYIVDFICLELGLVIEIDGGQHNVPDADLVRSSFLIQHGYRILRFWNNDVLANTDAVLAAIYGGVASARPHPNLSGAQAQPSGVQHRASQWLANAPPHPPQAGEGAKGSSTP